MPSSQGAFRLTDNSTPFVYRSSFLLLVDISIIQKERDAAVVSDGAATAAAAVKREETERSAPSIDENVRFVGKRHYDSERKKRPDFCSVHAQSSAGG